MNNDNGKAKKKYNAVDYMYCTSRIRALENNLIGSDAGNDRLTRLLGAVKSDEIIQRLPEFGVTVVRDQDGVADTEATFDGMISGAMALVRKDAPNPALFDSLGYRYDCNNIKAVLKCRSRNTDPGRMLSNCGSIPKDEIVAAVNDEKYDILPVNMAKAVPTAIDAFKKTGNPQLIDMIIDRACFADMLAGAKLSGILYFIHVVTTEIDLINLEMCVRVLRMNAGNVTDAGREFLTGSLLPGGTLSHTLLTELYNGGESGFTGSGMLHTEYAAVCAEISKGNLPLSQLEKISDNRRMEVIREAKHLTYGAEVPAAYIMAIEYEVKNLRIIIAGKNSGTGTDVIRERMRACYV